MKGETYIGKKGKYVAGREIGKGGEGAVYEVAGDEKLVLKLYSEPLSALKISKLTQMSSGANTQLDNFTAWVKDIVTDGIGKVCGFTMRKLVNYYPLHTLFGPMDRKKIFPDKGYNFLVHVARNLATAFHVCHTNGLVIGDVNEGNILVNDQGMIVLIDCDSFQIKNGDTYFFCEVGIPRYTSPELLSKASFNEVIRTINTDSFSLAILIFQLLFLGRHPFAGINNSNTDIDEELAIKNHWFAYSKVNDSCKLSPPKDTYSIDDIRPTLSKMFHRSFESTNDRPRPSDWIKELELYKTELIQCKKSKIHFYPGWVANCPWCDFAEKRNILYFLDDSYLENIGALNNIETFVNGFKIATINYPPIDFPTMQPTLVQAKPIDTDFKSYRWNHRIAVSLPVIAGFCFVSWTPWTIGMGIIASVILNSNLPWLKEIKTELKTRQDHFSQIKDQLGSAIKEYNSPKEIANYNTKGNLLLQKINKIKRLPEELQAKKRLIEERLYDNQLHVFLSNFEIRNYTIPSFGATRKLVLYTAGIRTASDISKLNTMRIHGIGPSFEQKLIYWQRHMASKFVYHPDVQMLRNEYSRITGQIEQTKRSLEGEIRIQFQEIENIRIGIQNRQTQLKKFIETKTNQYFQSQADLEAFKAIAS